MEELPHFTGRLTDDAGSLARQTADVERELARLPAAARRDREQRADAAAQHVRARAARRAFLDLHADAVYDLLTEDRRLPLRLAELLAGAAGGFPGLVPTAAQMAEESAHRQADKEGREIDQAIFFAALLAAPGPGRHLVASMQRPAPRSLDLLGRFRQDGEVALDSVLVRRDGPAAHITFRNGHCLNAEDARLIADLETAVDLVLLDDDVRVGVLRGGPVEHPRYAGRRVFSAGINLKDLRNGRIPFVDFLLGRELGYLSKILRGLRVAGSGTAVHKPWVGAVDTFAIGGGMQLLLVLDHVLAGADAYLSLPAADEGIVPGLANLRLGRIAGPRLARQVILDGRRIAMDEPDARLLVDEVVDPGELDAAVQRAATRFATPAVAANRRMIAQFEEPVDTFRTYLAEFAPIQAERAYSDDVLAKVEQRWQRSQSPR